MKIVQIEVFKVKAAEKSIYMLTFTKENVLLDFSNTPENFRKMSRFF